MSSENSYKINKHNKNKLKIEDPIEEFWQSDIWDIDYKHIKHEKIIQIFNQLKKIESEINLTKPKFSINLNYDVELIDGTVNKKKKIKKFKKDNLNFLKTHADCFYEYHKLINNYLDNKNLLADKNIENFYCEKSNINNPNTFILSQDMIDEHLNYYYTNIIGSKSNSNSNSTEKNIENNDLIIKKLKNNLDIFIKPLQDFIKKTLDNNKIYLIIDNENILKSFKIQFELEKIIQKDKFKKIFDIWSNGYFKEDEDLYIDLNISLSEFSSKIKYIEPFTSLGFNLETKLNLINIINKNFLPNYNTINIFSFNKKKEKSVINNYTNVFTNIDNLTSSSDDHNKISTNFNYTNINLSNIDSLNTSKYSDSKTNSSNKTINNLFLPIYYNKNDLREQDDHLILFIYTLLKKNNINVILISSDKFKWFGNNLDEQIDINNFKYLYDFDSKQKKIIIAKSYTPDIYKINNKYLFFPFINFPIIPNESVNLICEHYDIDNKFKNVKKNFFNYSNIIPIDSIKVINEYLLNLIVYEEEKKNDKNDKNFKTDYENILDFLVKYSRIVKNNLDNIFNYLESHTKKEIFKLTLQNENSYLKTNDTDKYIEIITQYTLLIENLLIMKTTQYIFFKNNKNIIQSHTYFYTNLIKIYDSMYDNLYKIRKLSNSKSYFSKLFAKLNITYIYIKKQGFLKKNYI